MASIPQIDQRLRKLLLYVGEQGPQFQTRDVKHLSTSVESIFQKHLKLQTQITPLISLITKCIISVPNKQHLYALMTGHLTKNHQDKMNDLINCVLLQLQSSMNTFKEANVRNILIYLSELMNFNVLNSFIFITWIESIVGEIKKANEKERQFYLRVVVGVVPYCWKSLDQKIGQDFKKLMDRVEKESVSLTGSLGEFWGLVYQQYSNKKLNDYSAQERLSRKVENKEEKEEEKENEQNKQKQEFKQFNPSFKLTFKDKSGQYIIIQQVKLAIQDDDSMYRQYLKTIQSYIDRQNLVTIVQSYSTIKSILYQKLKQYININTNPYLPKFLIETLWKQVFSKPEHDSVIFSSLFISMASEAESDTKSDLIKSIEESSLAIFSLGESLNSSQTQKFINVISLYYANINKPWQWTQWIEQQSMVNRHVILQLIFEKISILSDFKPTPELTPFIASKFQPALLDSQQSMFQSKILQFFNAKAQSEPIIAFINNPNQFIIFFNLLLTRMKNSLTHLTKLTERYKQVFQHFRYDRQTINCIFDFWQHSEYHKIQYFVVFLENNMISFEKFVEGISMKGKLSGAVEKVLLKRVYESVKRKVKEGDIEEGLANDLEQSLVV